jgi:hypothetical protein
MAAVQWWHTHSIPALGTQRQADLQNEFQNSQGYTEKPFVKKTQKPKKKKKGGGDK